MVAYTEEIEEILTAVKVLENIYDVVRIVDPVQNKVINTQKSISGKIAEDEPCYGLWEKEQFCDNCVSYRAIKENDTFVKFEAVNERIYMVTASPLYHKGFVYAIEMLNDITNKSVLEGLSGNVESDFTVFVKKFNDLLIRDGLTHLFNRRYIDEKLPVEIFHSTLTKKDTSLLMIDIDEFKKINDKYGHVAGDQVLQQFSDVVSSCLQEPNNWIARYGGEEFLVHLPGANYEKAYQRANEIRESVLAFPFKVDGINGAATMHISCSIGVCVLESGMDMRKWINCADKNLYLAKEKGGNLVC